MPPTIVTSNQGVGGPSSVLVAFLVAQYPSLGYHYPCCPIEVLMAKPRKTPAIPHVSPEEAQALLRKLDESIVNFEGPFEELESAMGMLILGRLVGWKVLVLIHNKRTIRKYEDILGINIREVFPEEGPFAAKSVALETVKKLGNFWKAVNGEVRIEDRRELSN